MNNNRKELKILSIFILAIVALTVIRAIVGICMNGIPQPTEIPEGMTKELAQIITVITFALSFVALIPQIYVGVKGLMVANGAASGKAHIVWALILAIFAGVSVFSGISDLTKAVNLDTVFNLIGYVADLAMFGFYYVYALKVKNGN
jgi:amino acid permease